MKNSQRVALVVPALLLVAACGTHEVSSDGSGGSTASTAAGTPSPATRDGDTAARKPVSGTVKAAQASEVETRAVISKGQISLHTKDIEKTRFDLQKLLDGWDGTISSENSDADAKGRTVEARLELRVPSARFDAAMDAISGLGELVDRSRTSQDVTTKVIDNNVRVRAQKLSLQRMDALLSQATTLKDILAIEDQLSSRQADLDSLESQQKYLADQTSLATIDVYLSLPAKATPHGHQHEHGFLTGLHGGWRTLGTSTVAVLTAVGAVLPFAVLLTLVGVPVLLLVRRRLHGTRPPAVEV